MISSEYSALFSTYPGEPGDLIPLLQKCQEHFGYVSEDAVREIAEFLNVSQNVVFGVASFYAQFKFSEPGRHAIRVCLGTACHVRGGQILSDALERELKIPTGETTPDKRFDFDRVACLGCCALAPVLQIDHDIYGKVNVADLKGVLEKYD